MANFDTLKAQIAARIHDNTEQEITAQDVRDCFDDTIDAINAAKEDEGAIAPAQWGGITGDLADQTDLKNALDAKQNVINDLSDIRSGATAGATAYQKPSSGIPASDLASAVQTSLGKADSALQWTPSGEINPEITPAEYATREEKEELDQKVGGKVCFVNGKFLYGSNGQEGDNSDYNASTFVDVSEYTQIAFSVETAEAGGQVRIVEYNSLKEFVSAKGYTNNNTAFNRNADTKYVRLSYLAEEVLPRILGDGVQIWMPYVEGIEGRIGDAEKKTSGVWTGTNEVFTFDSFPNNGRYLENGTYSNTGWFHTDLIAIKQGILLDTFITGPGSSTTPFILYYNSSQQLIGTEASDGDGYKHRYYTTPQNTAYVRVQTVNKNAGPYLSFQEALIGLNAVNEKVNNNAADINTLNANFGSLDSLTRKIDSLFVPNQFTIVGFINVNGEIRTNIGYHRTEYLDATNIEKVSVYMAVSAPLSVAPVVWFDQNKTFISAELMADTTAKVVVSQKPANARYIVLSTNDANVSLVKGAAMIIQRGKTAYLSPMGDDSANGTEAAPLKTAFGAKSRGAEEIVFLPGDYFDFDLDFSDFSNYVFRKGARLLGGERIEHATLSSGYSRVYQVEYDGAITANFLWQHDIADAATLVSSSEYLPQYHSGRTHRLSSTRLYKATSIAEIESTTDKYMWFASEGYLYFSAPSTNFAEHPVVIPSSTPYAATVEATIQVIGMTVMYRRFNSYKLSGRFDGGFVGYTEGTCFVFDSNKYLELNNIEAAGGDPDGFGGSFTDSITYDIVMKNCYGHDNADDGESGHIKTNITQYGGLYEYNGSGVTPAVGATGAYYNTICRNNGEHDWTVGYQDGTGFSAAAGSDPKTYILCVGCLSYGNKIGFQSTVGDGSSMCINCVSNNDSVASYRNIEQLNCITI